MAVLEVEGLSVALPASADRPFAVEDITLHVDAGEILCIVGESGSGKSVTAFSVMGLADKRALTPVAGTIKLGGEDLLTATDDRLRTLRGEKMAMIFQEPMTALNPVLRVGDQIGEMLEIHSDLSASARKAKVIEAMRDVSLPDPEKMYRSYPHQLSGGQRQRIMIAMALTLEPQLLIADEPTTALDVTTQAQILSLIKDIQRRKGMGVMFITHDFGVVAEIADRVAVMKHGRIVEQGSVAEVLGSPKDAYTQQLIAAVPSMTPPERPEAEGDVALETQDLVKTYGHEGLFGNGRVVKAASDVDLTVRRGETLGIVGESGSGKSTVARCVMRLIDPTSGAILIDGENIASLREGQLRPHRRDIQIVFQDPYRSLNPRRTVGQSIIEGPVNFGTSIAEAKSRAAELMQVVGLSEDALDRFPHQFSGGQRQRICIARALAMEPAILIADEAVSALDVSVQAQVLDLLDDVRRRFDLAMLFITHDLRVAAQICDRIMVMNKGQVVETGPTAAVYANPQHDYTRSLLAAAPGKAGLSA
ncbi:ABC transporter ATP-binding protein [Roseobacter sp. A03A-229]